MSGYSRPSGILQSANSHVASRNVDVPTLSAASSAVEKVARELQYIPQHLPLKDLHLVLKGYLTLESFADVNGLEARVASVKAECLQHVEALHDYILIKTKGCSYRNAGISESTIKNLEEAYDAALKIHNAFPTNVQYRETAINLARKLYVYHFAAQYESTINMLLAHKMLNPKNPKPALSVDNPYVGADLDTPSPASFSLFSPYIQMIKSGEVNDTLSSKSAAIAERMPPKVKKRLSLELEASKATKRAPRGVAWTNVTIVSPDSLLETATVDKVIEGLPQNATGTLVICNSKGNKNEKKRVDPNISMERSWLPYLLKAVELQK